LLSFLNALIGNWAIPDNQGTPPLKSKYQNTLKTH